MTGVGEMRRRHMNDMAALFCGPLAARTGRAASDIRARGLDAGAFHPGQELRITLADRSTMHLRYAFFVEHDTMNLVGVFSEHAGYHCFVKDDLTVEQIDDDEVTSSRSWPG